MNTNLTLPECILLLALNDATGDLERGLSPERLRRALIAAALLELTLLGKLRVLSGSEPAISLVQFESIKQEIAQYCGGSEVRRLISGPPAVVEIQDMSFTGHPYLDSCLKAFRKDTTSRFHTLDRLAQIYKQFQGETKPDTEFQQAARKLLTDGVLETYETTGGGLFRRAPETRLRTTGNIDSGEDSMRLHLVTSVDTSAVIGHPKLEERTLRLLCLVKAAKLTEKVFGKEKSSAVDWRINSLCGEASPASGLAFAARYISSGTLSEPGLLF